MSDELTQRIDAAVESVICRCKCGAVARKGQRNCSLCHAAYMREKRPKHTGLSPQARQKANARSYLREYVRRGKIAKGPCELCGTTENVQGHHADHSRPLDVVWLCKQHHDEVTRKELGFEFHAPERPISESEREAFRVAIHQYVFMCVDAGLDLKQIEWRIKTLAVDTAVKMHKTKKNAAKALDISPQALWNIQQGHHK